ncbi:MAG TPA: MerR family transcriptional regulator [Terriglobia bacterium]|nr:MerR family transcriptional regulator [Terriglobia bacterium]
MPDKLYFRIGEVSALTKTKPYVLRYWETEFPMLRPAKSKSGHRHYRRQDVVLVLKIKNLLYDKGFTIEGARRELKNHSKESSAQPPLFRSNIDVAELKALRREIQGILTMLSKRC